MICALAIALAGFTPLFNGVDLSGWRGDTAFWTVRDGAITGQTTSAHRLKQNTFLIWNGGEPANFELRARFRIHADNESHFANSGIQYRSRILNPARFIMAGYQADIDADPGRRYTGMFFEERGRRILARTGQRVRILPGSPKPAIEVIGATAGAAELDAALNLDRWNDYVIIAEGGHLRQFLNGVLTADVLDLDPGHAAASGSLGLQLHAGLPMTIQFKDLQLKRLP